MAMQDRRSIILSSVQKLLRLGISDPEIVMHLEEVGVPKEEAQQFLAEARGEGQTPIPEEPVSGSVLETVKEQLEETETPEEKNLERELEDEKTPQLGVIPEFKKKGKRLPTANLEDLWQKGILQTVTDKLQEMKQVRAEIDSLLDQKIENALRKETKKMDTLIKSQQTLILAKMNSSLEEKTRQVSELIDLKIKELKKMKEEKENAVSTLKIKQDFARDTFEKMSHELDQTVKERKSSLQEFNSELIQAKSKFEETIEEARQKLVALEERATQTLELETAIIDGMVKDSQNRIDRLTLEKVDELTKDVQDGLTQLEALKVGFNPEEVAQQIAEIRKTKEKLDQQIETAVESVAQQIEQRIEKELQKRLHALDTEYQEIIKNVSVEIIKKDMDELRKLKKEIRQELEQLKKNK